MKLGSRSPRIKYVLLAVSVLFVAYPIISFAAILHVPQDYPIVQDAIDNSQPCDTILLSEGEYTERIFITEHSLTIAGNYLFTRNPEDAANTILQAPAPQDTVWRVITIEPEDSTFDEQVSVVGLSIRNGYTDPSVVVNVGAGIAAKNVQLLLDGNWISANYGSGGGGGYFLDCEVQVNKCRIYDNEAISGCGLFFDRGTFFVRNSIFQENEGYFSGGGGGAVIRKSQGIFTGNQFINNSIGFAGGAIAMYTFTYDPETIEIVHNRFDGNSSLIGGAIHTGEYLDTLNISCNIFNNNWCSYPPECGLGGAIFITPATDSVTIASNYFSDNYSTDWGGGAIFTWNSVNLIGNIFSSNRGPLSGVIKAGVQGIVRLNIYNNLFYQNREYESEHLDYQGAIAPGPQSITIMRNCDLINNERMAVHGDEDFMVDARFNYWGSPDGPYHERINPGGTGDTVHVEVSCGAWYEEPCSGLLNPVADLLEDTLHYNQIPIESLVTLQAVLVNRGFEPLELLDASLEGDNFILDVELPQEVTVFDTITVPVHFHPVAEGLYTGILTLTTNDTLNPEIEVVLEGEGVDVSVAPSHGYLPSEYRLESTWPNPFNPSFSVNVELPEMCRLQVRLYDVLGRIALNVTDEEYRAGVHTLHIDGSSLASGMYFLHVETPGVWEQVRRVVLLK